MEYNYESKTSKEINEVSVSKNTIMKAFNKHFFEFLDDLLIIFPKNAEIVSGKMSSKFIHDLTPGLLIKGWYKYVVLPYEDIINDGDLSFFFDKDYNQEIEHLSNSNEILKCINNIRGPIKQLDKSNLIHTTKYIQNLTRLSKLYNNSK